MEHFKELTICLQTINLKTIPPEASTISTDGQTNLTYSIIHENPFENESFGRELEILKQLALIDISLLEGRQILALLKKLYVLQGKFIVFNERFNSFIKAPDLEDFNDYYKRLMLDQLFFLRNQTESDCVISFEFLSDLSDSLQWREEVLSELIEEMETAVTIDDSTNEEILPEEIRSVSSTPLFSTAFQTEILNVLLDYFMPDDRDALRELVISRETPPRKLTFLGNGNQLADAFKQLVESNLITGCSKRQLERWMTETFQYQYKNSLRPFTARYLNGIISTEGRSCQSPILDVKKKEGTFTIVPLVRNKKTKK